MGKRRKRRSKDVPVRAPTPELKGVALLLSQWPVATLDLHGYTAEMARPRIRDFLTTHSRISAGDVVHIITGKGTGVLLNVVRDVLPGECADQVDEYAGMMGGGGWVVRVK